MIVVAIAGMLAAVAYPSSMAQVRKARRVDAIDVVTRVQQAQERRRADNPSFATLAALGIPATSPSGYYTLASSATAGSAATSCTVTAKAVSGKPQASDSGCTTLTLCVAGGTPGYAPATCWKR